MSRKKKLTIELITDTEVQRAKVDAPRYVVLEFQGMTYSLNAGDSFTIRPNLKLGGDFETEEIETLEYPVKVVSIG